jgi:hypothetical protein
MRTRSRQYAAVRNAKIRRLAEEEAREQERSARLAAELVGLCPSCGADREGGESHSLGCKEAA